jgi:hypothetical protein
MLHYLTLMHVIKEMLHAVRWINLHALMMI